jgi:pyridine nucleotide-disulfide oxidoreductase
MEDAVIVGAGHAGLSISRALTDRGIDHVVLERGQVGQTWRGRWDSFCLVTPNWLIALTGAGYDGDDPDGYMPRDDLVAFLERYAAGAPVRAGVDVTGARPIDGGFALETSDGEIRTRTLIASTGAFQRAHVPSAMATLPDDLTVLDATTYRRPEDVPDGGVLIVGSGQTGAQLAEELHDDGRDVVLACGRAPWMPRRIGDHDLVWWLVETGFLDDRLEDLPDPAMRLTSNPLTTGHGGGRDLHYRTLQASGVTLVGRFLGTDDGTIVFADDLADSVAWGDARFDQQMESIRDLIAQRGLDVEVPSYAPFAADGPTSIPADRFSTVLLTGGFRPNYTEWLPWQDAFDEHGFPLHNDGESTEVEGLFFMGVHFLRKRKSGILWGAEEDANVVADRVAKRLARPRADPPASAPARYMTGKIS